MLRTPLRAWMSLESLFVFEDWNTDTRCSLATESRVMGDKGFVALLGMGSKGFGDEGFSLLEVDSYVGERVSSCTGLGMNWASFGLRRADVDDSTSLGNKELDEFDAA